MNWNFEGMHVTGMYMDQFLVSGVVDISRVKYGGNICHHIELDQPIEVYGAVRSRVILDHGNITQVAELA